MSHMQHHFVRNITLMTSKGCAFYGFRWPRRQTDLFQVGGNECGLDFDTNGPCKMESCGQEIDFQQCPTAAAAKTFLEVVAVRVRFFPSGQEEAIPFRTWNKAHRRNER